MGVDKQGSKNGGGYVGGFLQLFDWNGKSRKKLFSSKSDFPEGSKHQKRSEGSSPMTRVHLIEDDDYGRSSIKGSSDYSCASSITDDEGIGTKAPNVVARLMGLDCLPTSGVAEPYSSPIYECRSLRDAHYRRTPEFFYEGQTRHMRNQSTELEGFHSKPVETRPQKMFNRPIERFQSETLPPKSAKSIPLTHHKLLSPIKNPGFIPTKNAAQIMEEAAKIIERGPQASIKGKMQQLGSQSVSLKFRDMKEKMEAVHRPSKLPETSQRPTGSNVLKHLKGQSLNKSWNGSEDTPQLRNSPYSEDSNFIGSKNKGKSISLAVQAKVNVQRREGLGSTGNRISLGQKEHQEPKSKKPFRSQLTTQKSMQKKPSIDKASGVLRQNNQKQNGLTNRDRLPSNPSVPNQQDRKPLSVDAFSDRTKSSNKVGGTSKVGSRKTTFDTYEYDTVKEAQSSKTQNFPRKKRSLERDFHFEKIPFGDTVSVNRNEMPIQSNVVMDAQLKWVDENRRKGMDVVSFTFTSPLKKSLPGSQSPGQLVEKNINFCLEASKDKLPTDAKDTRLSSLGWDVIGGDALSILLEQKIKELTHGVESSFHSSVKSGSVASPAASLQDLVSEFSALSTTAREHRNRSQQGDQCASNCSSHNGHELQGAEEMDDCCSSNNSEARKDLDCRHPSPVSVLEPSFSNESSNSSDSGDSYFINGGKQCLSSEAQQMVNSICQKMSPAVETETELSDSASFTFTGIVKEEPATRSRLLDHITSDKWELDYVREILCNAELMYKDFTLGRARDIINPHLFDRLENRKTWSRNFSDDFKLRRKTLFDCVGEVLDLRCRKYVGGGSEKWAKGMAMVRRKEWLAEDVYKEISGLRSMGNWLLDEVVEKDMSTQNGKWVDFEIEEFEVGVEIEKKILSSLVDEIVVDMLLHKP